MRIYPVIFLVVVLWAGCKTPESKTAYWKLFVGTYTKKEGHVDGKAAGVYQYRMDVLSGELSPGATITGLVNPSFIATSPDGYYLYAVEETGPGDDSTGHINAFERSDDGSYKLLSRQSTFGFAPCHVAVDQEGQFVFVANYVGGVVAMYPLESDGRLSPACHVVTQTGTGPNPEQEASHPHQVAPSADGRFLYVPDKGADRIFAYSINREQRRLDLLPDSLQTRLTPGAGPRHLVFHPAYPMAYVINELNATVTVLSVEPNGALRPEQNITTLPADYTGKNWCADIHLSADGRYVYASNRGHNSLAIFSVNPNDGRLQPIGHQSVKGEFPRNFAISPDGRYLLVANQNTDNLVLFNIGEDGLLQFVRETEVKTPVCLVLR